MIKFGIQNGLNVARAGYSEDQIADRERGQKY